MIKGSWIGLFLPVIAFSGIAAMAADRRVLYEIKAPAAPGVWSVASVRESEIEFPTIAIESATALELQLLDGDRYLAERGSLELRGPGDYTWHGTIGRDDVVITVKGVHVSGLVYSRGAVYEIVPRGSKHFLVELDQRRFPECGGATESDLRMPQAGVAPLATVDSGDRIDVLVVYTTATKNNLGGDAQAQAFAEQAIAATNTAYLNSRINQRIRLVHAAEWVYTETASGSTDLANLRADANVQALRDTHRADLVAMIGEIQGACGVGYLMGSNQTNGNPNNGFTVTARSCAVGNLSFAHELGHNMGSAHNPENGSGATYPFGYGHWVNGSYRTVMSYVEPCTSGCTRRPYFSNPMVEFNGVPTGVDNSRDNARSMNLTADPIANYRYSGKNLRLLAFTGGETLPRGIRRTLAWDSDNVAGDVRIELSRDEGTTWTVINPSTPNDGSENLTVWGSATRRARVRIVSIADGTVSDSSSRNFTIR
jgi:hypothetical protein